MHAYVDSDLLGEADAVKVNVEDIVGFVVVQPQVHVECVGACLQQACVCVCVSVECVGLICSRPVRFCARVHVCVCS